MIYLIRVNSEVPPMNAELKDIASCLFLAAIFIILALLYGWFASAGPSYAMRRLMQQWPGRNPRTDPKSDDYLHSLVEKGVKQSKNVGEDWEKLEGPDKDAPS